MNKNFLSSFSSFLMLGVIGFVGFSAINVLQELKRESAEAKPQILVERPKIWEEDTGSNLPATKTGYEISYQYIVNGKTYETTSEDNDWYKPGNGVKVCYNPANPEEADLKKSGYSCGATSF